MPTLTASPAFSNSPIVERNRLASWKGGVWASAANRAGWGQNTKEYDPAAQLTYMYQRWYDPALGIFTSTAPYPPMMPTVMVGCVVEGGYQAYSSGQEALTTVREREHGLNYDPYLANPWPWMK